MRDRLRAFFMCAASGVIAFAGCDGKATTPAPSAHHAPSQDDHGAAHVHSATHGGTVASVGRYHVEAVASKAGLLVFLRDEREQPLPLAGVSGSVLLSQKDGGAPVEAALEPMGDHLHALVTLAGHWTAVVTLTIGGETLTARFAGEAAASHAHGGHDHGAAAVTMPAMELSETVTASVVPREPIAVGAPATLMLSFARQDTGAALTDLEVVHERRLHVFIVSDDLSFFAHVHPEVADAAAGTWTLDQSFPAAGRYHVYADFRSRGAGANVTRTDLEVSGERPAERPLTVDTRATKTFGDLTVTTAWTPSVLTVGDAILTYTLSDAAGRPVTDLAPYLGAFGHLFILKDDKVTMAHAHPRGAEPTGDQRGGPEVSFHAHLPTAGTYKLWAQFLRGGQVITTDWTVEVR